MRPFSWFHIKLKSVQAARPFKTADKDELKLSLARLHDNLCDRFKCPRFNLLTLTKGILVENKQEGLNKVDRGPRELKSRFEWSKRLCRRHKLSH